MCYGDVGGHLIQMLLNLVEAQNIAVVFFLLFGLLIYLRALLQTEMAGKVFAVEKCNSAMTSEAFVCHEEIFLYCHATKSMTVQTIDIAN